MDNVTIGLALAAGILSFISPCVLPLVPAYIGYMSGRLTHNVSQQMTSGASSSAGLAMRLQMLLHGIAFVFGFTLVFVLIGLFTTALSSVAGRHVGAFTEIIGRVGGLVIIFFGFQFMGLAPQFFAWLRKKGQAGILDNVLLSLGFVLVAGGVFYWGFLGQALVALPLTAALALAIVPQRRLYTASRILEPIAGMAGRGALCRYPRRNRRERQGRPGRLGIYGHGILCWLVALHWSPTRNHLDRRGRNRRKQR